MNRTIDVDYCYLDDVGNGDFNPTRFKNDLRIKNRMFNEKPYKDPDAYSKLIYEDIKNIFEKKLPNGETLKFKDIQLTKYGTYNFELKEFNGKNIERFSCDFIGPSSNSAFTQGISDLEVGNYLKEARTIGGHIFWPVPNKKSDKLTINTARGGSKGFNDRFDLTLIDLKKYFSKHLNKVSESNVFNETNIKLEKQYLDSHEWFEKFVDFKGFIDFFLLQDFVDENYCVKLLAPISELIPNDYRRYINNSLDLIRKRNFRIANTTKKEL